MTCDKTILRIVLLLLACSICGCKRLRPSSIIETDIGLVTTSLQLWQVDEGVRAFIEEKGWTHSQEFIHSWQFKLIATTPENETLTFECLQERTEKPKVTIYVPKSEVVNQQELSNELAGSLWERFYR